VNGTKLFGFSLLFALPVIAEQTQQNSTEAEQQFTLGQKMAECAAFFRFLADLPSMADKPETKLHAENKARGWELTAALFIANGSTPERSTHTDETVKYMVDAKKSEFASLVETKGPKGFEELSKVFDNDCVPLVTIQTKAIEGMRRGVASE
jgi:hypothetical protein